MKKVFIDCGAHDGCSVRKFLDTVEDASGYEIHSFEPNPNLAHYHPVESATFHNKAVWITDGNIEFFNFDRTGGSSILPQKNNRNEKKLKAKPGWQKKIKPPEKITVPCIDLSRWVKDNFDKDDYIILKMDIEGAEYHILYKMLEESTAGYINEMWIEWHFTNQQKYKDLSVLMADSIKEYGVKLVDWDAMHEPYLLETHCTEHKDF